MESAIDEAVDLTFLPTATGAGEPVGEIELRHNEEPPEPLAGGMIDLGALATEFLVLGIDPYPRKSGVEFGSVTIGEDAPKPFAALEALKKRLGGGEP